NLLQLLHFAVRFASGMTHRDPAFLGQLVDHLDQVFAPLLVEGRNRDPGETALTGRFQAQVGLPKSLLDARSKGLVERLHGEEPRLGRRHHSDLIERDFAAVGLYPNDIEQRGGGLAATDTGELAASVVHRLVHQFTGVLDTLGNAVQCAHWTIVPTGSPRRTRSRLPAWFMLKTMIGSLLVWQRPKALRSMTSYPFTRASWKVSSGMCRAAGSFLGSAVNTPSTLVPLSMTSASIS